MQERRNSIANALELHLSCINPSICFEFNLLYPGRCCCNLKYVNFMLKNDILSIQLTHWGRVTHICVDKLTIIGSDNGLSPGRRQTIIWTNVRILLIGPLGANFSEILIAFQTFSFKKVHLNVSSAKWQPFCFGLNVFKHYPGINARGSHWW